MRKFSFIFLCMLLAASCFKDRYNLYGDTVMADVLDPVTLKADNGFIYNVVSSDAENIDLREEARVYINYDILQKKSGTEYDIHINAASRVLKKDAVLKGSGEYGQDAINLDYGWFSANYLNIRAIVPFFPELSTAHVINLEFDSAASDADTLRFTLRHDAQGASPKSGDPVEGTALGYCYFSAPLSGLLPPEQDEIIVKVTWNWFDFSAPETDPEHYPGLKAYSLSGRFRKQS